MEHAQNVTQAHNERGGISIECSFTIHIESTAVHTAFLLILTVLSDEGDAAVHNDGDVVSTQLLLSQSVSFPACCSLDVRVPQREICASDALQVDSPDGETKTTIKNRRQNHNCINWSSSHLPFSTKTRMSFFSWFSVSEATPLTQTESASAHQSNRMESVMDGPGSGLTQLLQTVQVDYVLCRSIVSGTDEEVGLLQNKVCLFPLLRVQHGPVSQQTNPLKLPSQQAVTTEGGCSLMVKDITVNEHSKVKVIRQ